MEFEITFLQVVIGTLYVVLAVPVTIGLRRLERAYDYERHGWHTKRSGYTWTFYASVWPIMVLTAVVFTLIVVSSRAIIKAHKLASAKY